MVRQTPGQPTLAERLRVVLGDTVSDRVMVAAKVCGAPPPEAEAPKSVKIFRRFLVAEVASSLRMARGPARPVDGPIERRADSRRGSRRRLATFRREIRPSGLRPATGPGPSSREGEGPAAAGSGASSSGPRPAADALSTSFWAGAAGKRRLDRWLHVIDDVLETPPGSGLGASCVSDRRGAEADSSAQGSQGPSSQGAKRS